MKNKTIFYIFFSLVCLALLTPLLSFKAMLFPFVTSKAFYFRIIIELALPFYVYLVLANKSLRPSLKQPMGAAVLAFLAFNIISVFVGVNGHRSFWGNFERMGGVYYLAHLVLLYFYLLLVARQEPKFLQKFLKILVWVAALVSLNAISGKLGGPKLTPDLSLPNRASGTLGNPIFLASFLILPLALSLFFALQAEARKQKVFYYISAALILIAIYFSGTRGAVVGIAAAAALSAALFVFLNKETKTRKIGLGVLGVIILLGAGIFLIRNKLPEQSLLRRAANLTDGNAQARLLQWKVAIKGFKDYPVFGTGAENYYLVANRYYDPQQYLYDQSWFDKPHNYILEILATNGIAGFGAYLAMLAAGFWALWKAFRAELLTLPEFSVLSSGWAAYQIQNLFVFDTVSAAITMFAFAGFVGYLYEESSVRVPSGDSKKMNLSGAKIGLAATGVLALYAVYTTNILPMQSAKNINYGLISYTKSSPPNFELAKKYFDTAENSGFNYDSTELFFKYSDMALASAQSSGTATEDLVKDSLSQGIALGEKTAQLSPENPVVRYYLAALRYFESVVNKAPIPEAAQADLNKAGELAPGRPEIYYLNIQFKVAKNDLTGALELAKEYRSLYPQVAQATWQMAWVNHKLGNVAEAGKFAEQALDQDYNLETLKEAQLLINYYRSQKKYGEVVRLYEEAAEYDSTNVEVYLGLVRAYADNGQIREAESLAKDLVEAEPSLKEQLGQWVK